MTSSDVISTLESAHASLATMLRDNETQIAKLNDLVSSLESRIQYLEQQLESARAWGKDVTEQRNRALDELQALKGDVQVMQEKHESDLSRLKNIILAVHEHIHPVVNPPYVPKPGEQPRDASGRFKTWGEMTQEEQQAHPDLEPPVSLPVPLDDPEKLHNTVADTVGEPRAYPKAVGDYNW